MDYISKKRQSNKKAKERKQRLLEMDRKSCCCNCGDRGNREKKTFGRATKFSDLPEEIIIEILSYFSLGDLLRFKQVINSWTEVLFIVCKRILVSLLILF